MKKKDEITVLKVFQS